MSFLLCFVALFFSPKIQAIEVKPYTGLVNDFANVLSDDTEQSLEEKLATEASRAEGVELAVITLPSLEGEVIESVALQYFDNWQVGKKGLDNGVILLLAIEDREIRIQTGYGLEGVLPDGLTGRIIRQDIVPHLKEGNYDLAVESGVSKILAYALDPSLAAAQSTSHQAGYSWLIFVIVFVVLVIFILRKMPASSVYKPTPFSSGFKLPSSRSSSSSSSTSSFKFGGGRSGGGGASGKW